MYKKISMIAILMTTFTCVYGMEDDLEYEQSTIDAHDELNQECGHCEEFGLESASLEHDSLGYPIASRLVVHEVGKGDVVIDVDTLLYPLFDQPLDDYYEVFSSEENVLSRDKLSQDDLSYGHQQDSYENNRVKEQAHEMFKSKLIKAIEQGFVLGFEHMDLQFVRIHESLKIIDKKLNILDDRVDKIETRIYENTHEIECIRGELIAQHDDNLSVVEEKEDVVYVR